MKPAFKQGVCEKAELPQGLGTLLKRGVTNLAEKAAASRKLQEDSEALPDLHCVNAALQEHVQGSGGISPGRTALERSSVLLSLAPMRQSKSMAKPKVSSGEHLPSSVGGAAKSRDKGHTGSREGKESRPLM